MGPEGDPRVTAAKELLRTRLEDVSAETSAACHDRLADLQYRAVANPAADPIIRAAIGDWREKSLASITEGFESLIPLTRELQQDAGNASAEMAKILCWEAIDQAFCWTSEDRNNLIRFKEWQSRALSSSYVNVPGLVTPLPGCSLQDASLVRLLNCDFRARFERLLNQLRNRALLNTPVAQSTAVYDPEAPGPWTRDPNLDCRDAKTLGIARAGLVKRVRCELDYFKPMIEGRKDKEIEELASQYPKRLIFARRGGKLQLLGNTWGDLLKRSAYATLSFAIAAFEAGIAPSTMETTWKDYKKFLSKK